MKKTILFLVFISFCYNVQSQDSLLIEQMRAHATDLIINGQQWTGEGAEFLMQAADDNQFFLIGEPHGIAEVPLFTASLIRKIKNKGYHYFLAETGPYTAGILESYGDDFSGNISDHLTKYPLSLPFYNWKEEAEVLKAILENNPHTGPVIWGLDQEFAASYRMFFQWLEDTANTTESKAIATEYSDVADQAFKDAFEKKNPAASIMGKLSSKDFDKMDVAFEGQAACLDLIKELRETTHIYQLWFQREGYESNRLRAELMKRHFNQYYNLALEEGEVKVIGKMGSNHFFKGRNTLNVHDIGNHVHELASQEGTSSFHLYILPKKGTSNSWNPFTQKESDKSKAFDNTEGPESTDYAEIAAVSSDDHYTVIDLRPLRKELFNKTLKLSNEWIEKLIWSYDAVLVMNEVSAASNYD